MTMKLKKPLVLPAVVILLSVLTLGVIAQGTAADRSLEAEAGTLSGSVERFSSAQASGGNAVRFGTVPTGGGPNLNNGALPNVASGVNQSSWIHTPNWLVWPRASENYPAFRTFCEFSHLAWDDPIVYPGQTNAAHLHVFFGNTIIDENSTYQSLRTTGNSTCEGGPLNRTAYWMPALFDGAGNVVAPSDIELYYKAENLQSPGRSITEVQEFPNGLRMIAGASGTTTAGSGLTWGWNCDGGSNSSTIPNCNNASRLEAWVRFPYCWDGVNLDSPDHRSHMAYGTNNTWGTCPSSHPVHVPEITEKFHWYNTGDSSSWYISSDRAGRESNPAPDGSTLHADWFGAWEDSIETTWVSQCLRKGYSVSLGDLCNGTMLKPIPNYTGSRLIPGWTPSP